MITITIDRSKGDAFYTDESGVRRQLFGWSVDVETPVEETHGSPEHRTFAPTREARITMSGTFVRESA